MENKKINLNEILDSIYINELLSDERYKMLINKILYFSEQLLELASENAKIYTETYCSPYSENWTKEINKKSITDTINQIKL